MSADSVGDGFDGGAQGGDLVGEPGEGAAGGGAVAVLVDDRAEGGVAVEGGAAEAGAVGDGGEGDGVPSWWSWAQARSTWLRVLVLVIRLAASLIRVSSRAMSWRCRVGFGDPAAFLGVVGECFGVDALGGEDRQ